MNKKRKIAELLVIVAFIANMVIPMSHCYQSNYPGIISDPHMDIMIWDHHIWNGQVTYLRRGGGVEPAYYLFLYNGLRVIQLAENEYNWGIIGHQFHSGQVTWDYYDGHDYEIFLYDGDSIIQLTDNDYSDTYPDIFNGQVVWSGYDGHDSEIYLYDGTSITQLTDNEYDDGSPHIHNGQIVWVYNDGNDNEIFFYDGYSTIQLTDNNLWDDKPQIHNGQVTWVQRDSENNNQILLYDGDSTIQITDNEYDNDDPQLHNGQVAWRGYDGQNWQVFLYNGDSIIQLTDNEGDSGFYRIYDGRVVWDYGGNIYLYDGDSTIQITEIGFNTHPEIYNEQIAWEKLESRPGIISYVLIYPENYLLWEFLEDCYSNIQSRITSITSALSRISITLNNILNEIGTTQDRINHVITTLNKKMSLNVVSGAKTSEHLTYYLHLTQWPDGELLDTLHPSVTWRIGINERILEADEYQIQSMSLGLCKLTVNRDSVPLGNNMIFIEAEKRLVTVSAIEEISNTIGETVNIGVILPSEAKYDTSQPVLDLAEAHINDYCSNVGYDISFDFILEDAGGTAIGHQEKVETLHDSGVDMLIAGFWSSQAAESLEYVNDNDMIMFSPSSTSHDLAIPNDNLYRLVSDDTLQAKAIATLLERYGVDSIIVMQPDWGLINSITDALEAEFTDRGGTMYPRIVYPVGAMNDLGFDFTDYLVEAEALAYDNVKDENVSLVVLGLEETAQIMNQVYVGYKDYSTLHDLDWFGWMETPFSTIESVAPDAAARYGMASTVAVPTKSKQWFDFSDSLGYEPTFYDACIYDICWIYAKSVLESASVSTENIKSVMPEVTSQYFGVTGWCNLNEDGDRYSVDYDIMSYDEVFGWRTWGTYEKIAETIFEK
jgi:ABC-type branched-subunit amino acid transport system substrate-binding protein